MTRSLPATPRAGGTIRALQWAQDAIASYGRPRADGSVELPCQADLNVHFGFDRGSGATSAYLRALGPAVRRKRGGVVLDELILRRLLDEAEATPDVLPSRTAAVARDLALRLGQPSEHGTALMATRNSRQQPATEADMATALGLSRSSVHRHLLRLRAAGRLRLRGRTWTFQHQPPVPVGRPVRTRDRRREQAVATTIRDVYSRLEPLAGELEATALALSAELGRDDRLLLVAGCRQLAEIIAGAVDDMAG
nr:hypothetical protein [Actinomycetota bacterium]